MVSQTQSWVVDWFRERNPEATIDVEDNYYKQGLVDSFGVIELINDVEKHFSIMFDDKNFQDPPFRTIQGLAKLIDTIKDTAD